MEKPTNKQITFPLKTKPNQKKNETPLPPKELVSKVRKICTRKHVHAVVKDSLGLIITYITNLKKL